MVGQTPDASHSEGGLDLGVIWIWDFEDERFPEPGELVDRFLDR